MLSLRALAKQSPEYNFIREIVSAYRPRNDKQPMPNWTILKLIEWTTEYFTKHGIPNPRLDTELLLSHVLKKKRIELYLEFEKVVSENDLAAFKALIQRRSKREPLQYIIGSVDFCGVPIKVTPAVLIPRPETEILVEECLKLQSHLTILPSCHLTICDLCTGSACIIAALANELPDARFVGIDISGAALDVARQNTEKWKDRVELRHGNLFEPLRPPDFTISRSYDFITSNPPYVPEDEFAALQPEVRDFEPKEALIAGKDGLEIIREIINNAHSFLKPGGHLVMEIGDGQADAVRGIITDSGHYNEPELIKDYGGIERVVIVKNAK